MPRVSYEIAYDAGAISIKYPPLKVKYDRKV